MSASRQLLLLEDDDDQRLLLESLIADAGYQVHACARVPDALAAMAERQFDLVLSDWKVADGDGLKLLAHIRAHCPDTAFILMTAYGNLSHAISTIRAGADDYLIKPFDKSQLIYTLARVSTVQQLQQENRSLREAINHRDQLVDLIGRAEPMQQVFRRVQKIAPTKATVLLYGESGTGKELAARALHQLSDRAGGPFVALNCAALPETLFEAELFGAEKGAYTGADKLKIGRIEAAAGGSLFLDEIGELPLGLQAKLLRVLQEGSYQRLGNPRELAADVRIVAATNRDLQQEVDAGRFRADLYYRLNVVPIRLPPLRERREDIPLLVQHFVQQACRRHGLPTIGVHPELMKRLCARHWTGNVRELAHTLERLVLLAEGELLTPADLENEPTGTAVKTAFVLPEDGLNWESHERECLQQALQRCQFNRTQAARLLGLPYKAFLYRLEKFNLVPDAGKEELEDC
ncbi:MAG: sigma-54-dependent transcriptional regulator [Pseudomonadota bacterium]